jgi:hypothetical protein
MTELIVDTLCMLSGLRQQPHRWQSGRAEDTTNDLPAQHFADTMVALLRLTRTASSFSAWLTVPVSQETMRAYGVTVPVHVFLHAGTVAAILSGLFGPPQPEKYTAEPTRTAVGVPTGAPAATRPTSKAPMLPAIIGCFV